MATYDKKFIIKVRPSLTDDARASLDREVKQMTSTIEKNAKLTYDIDVKRESRQKMVKLKKEMKEIAGLRITGKTDLGELDLNEKDLARVTKKLERYNELKNEGPKRIDANSVEFDKVIKKVEKLNNLYEEMADLDISNADDLKKGNALLEEYEKTAQSISRLGYDKNAFSSPLKGELESQNKSRINGEGIKETTESMEKLKVEADQAEKGLKDVNVQLDKTGDSSKEVNKVEDGVDKIGKTAKKTAASVDKVNKELKDPKGRKNIEKTKDSTNKLADSFRKMSHWAMFAFATRILSDQLRESIRYIKELDVVLTEISVVTGKSRKEVYKLGREFNNMAKRLGRSTAEVANASKIFFRQGKSTEQVMLLVEASTKAASVAHIDLAEASDYLTSTLNGFKMEASQAMEVVDKFSAVGANAGTSFEEMAQALKKVASAASNANVDMDHMISYLATVSEVTREAPENIGTSFKTLFARMQKITDGDMPSELNKVDQALQSIGISLKDDTGQIKSLQLVVEQLGGKWESLTKNQQAYLATSIAGTRQQVRFISLMDNYDRSLEILDTSLNSAGEGQRQFNNYLEGFEAKLKAAKAEVEALYSTIKETGGLEKAVEVFTDLTKALNALIEKGELAKIGIMALNVALAALIVKSLVSVKSILLISKGISSIVAGTFMVKATAGVTAATGAITGLSMAIVPLLATFTALGVAALAIYGVVKWNSKLAETAIRLDKVAESVEKASEKLSNFSNSESRVGALMKQREKVIDQLDDESIAYEEAVAAREKLLDIDKEIAQILPETATAFNEQGEAIAINTELIQENIVAKRKQLIDELKSAASGGGLTFESLKEDSTLSYRGIEKGIKEYQAKVKRYERELEQDGVASQTRYSLNAELARAKSSLGDYERAQEKFMSLRRGYFQSLEDYDLVGKTTDELLEIAKNTDLTGQDIVDMLSIYDENIDSLSEASGVSMEIGVELIPQKMGEERFLKGIKDLTTNIGKSPELRKSMNKLSDLTAEELNKAIENAVSGKGTSPAMIAMFEQISDSMEVAVTDLKTSDLAGIIKRIGFEYENATEVAGDFLKLTESLNKKIDGNIENQKKLTGYLNEYNQTAKFTAETIIKISREYPHLNAEVISHIELQAALVKKQKELTESLRKDFQEKVFYNEKYSSESKTIAKDLLETMAESRGVELGNYKDLYVAKQKIFASFATAISGLHSRLVSEISGDDDLAAELASKKYMRLYRNNPEFAQFSNITAAFLRGMDEVNLDNIDLSMFSDLTNKADELGDALEKTAGDT